MTCDEALRKAVVAMRKQVPQEPTGQVVYINGEPVIESWICPDCGKSYSFVFERYEFCPECGQRIDWMTKEDKA